MYTWAERQATGSKRVAPGIAALGGTLRAHAAVFALQRSAGNAAVARLLRDASTPGANRPAAVQRIITQTTADLPPKASNGLGPPAKLPDAEEASYKDQGEAKLTDLGGGASSTSTAGHTTVGPIEGFPDWFTNLQSALVSSQDWRPDKEETAQQLLADYGLKRFAVPYQGDTSKVPPTVRVYLQYVGRSTSNQRAADKAGLPSSKALGGSEGAKMWCAAAGSSSVQLALKAAGLTVDDRITGWNAWLTSPPVPAVGMPTAAVDARIEPGDQVSYIGGGAPAIGGHTVTALSTSQGEGTVFDHASGNAGGGSSGSIRLGSSQPRAKIPGTVSLTDIQTKSPAALNAPNDRTWIYIVVQYSRFWADLGAIDPTAAGVWQSESGKQFLKKYKLKPTVTST